MIYSFPNYRVSELTQRLFSVCFSMVYSSYSYYFHSYFFVPNNSHLVRKSYHSLFPRSIIHTYFPLNRFVKPPFELPPPSLPSPSYTHPSHIKSPLPNPPKGLGGLPPPPLLGPSPGPKGSYLAPGGA